MLGRRLLARLIGDHGEHLEDLDRVGIAAGGAELIADVPDVRSQDLLGRGGSEDRLGVVHRKALPARRRAGLVDERGALWRRFAQVDGGHLEVGTLVLDRVDLRRVGEDPARAIT